MAHDLARECWIDGLAPALFALMSRHINGVGSASSFFNARLRCSAQMFRFVEEQVLLVRSAGLAFGGEQIAFEFVELLLEQVTFGAHQHQFAFE